MLVTTYVGTFWVCYVWVLLCRINSGWCFKDHVHCKMLPVILNRTAQSGHELTLSRPLRIFSLYVVTVVTEDLHSLRLCQSKILLPKMFLTNISVWFLQRIVRYASYSCMYPSCRKAAYDTSDPSEGLMNLLKKMYAEGDDEMKRTINKAWVESREKQSKGDIPMDI